MLLKFTSDGGEVMNDIQLGISQSRGYENVNLELIKVTTNEQGQKLVSARELHDVLVTSEGKQERFSQWFKRHLQYGFEENVDYVGCKKFYTANQHGAIGELDDYAMTIDMAKELAMLQKSEKGRKVRQYFIECEKVAQQSHEMPKMTLEEIMIAQLQEQQRIKQQQAVIEQQVQTVEQRMTNFEENSALDPGEYSLVCSRVSSRVHAVLKERGINREQVGELFKALNRDIKEITGVKTRTQLRKRHLDMVLDFINDWQPSRATMITINQMSLEI